MSPQLSASVSTIVLSVDLGEKSLFMEILTFRIQNVTTEGGAHHESTKRELFQRSWSVQFQEFVGARRVHRNHRMKAVASSRVRKWLRSHRTTSRTSSTGRSTPCDSWKGPEELGFRDGFAPRPGRCRSSCRRPGRRTSSWRVPPDKTFVGC